MEENWTTSIYSKQHKANQYWKKGKRWEYFLFSINKVVSIFLLKKKEKRKKKKRKKKTEQPVNNTANNAKLIVKKKRKKEKGKRWEIEHDEEDEAAKRERGEMEGM